MDGIEAKNELLSVMRKCTFIDTNDENNNNNNNNYNNDNDNLTKSKLPEAETTTEKVTPETKIQKKLTEMETEIFLRLAYNSSRRLQCQ